MKNINYISLVFACLFGFLPCLYGADNLEHIDKAASLKSSMSDSNNLQIKTVGATINYGDEESEDLNDDEEEAEDDSEELEPSELEKAFSLGYAQGFDAGFNKGFEIGLKKAEEFKIISPYSNNLRPQNDMPIYHERKKQTRKVSFYDESNVGSAKKLIGKTNILTVFIAEKQWSSEDKKNYIAILEKAEDWLKKQSEKYGIKNIEFKNTFAGLEKDILIDNIFNGVGSSKEHFDMGQRVFKKLGYSDMLEYERKAKEENPDCQNFLVLICADKNGSGYSQPCYRGAENKVFLDWAILYTKYKDGKFDDWTPQNIAHEILHIFGAWDLYLASDHTNEQADYAKKHFPNDIMRETYRDFSQLEIGPLTAWRVGLSDEKKDWFDYFEPDFYKNR